MPDRPRRIAHVLPSTDVIGGTEHATLRIARAVEPAGFGSMAFCIDGDTPVARFFAREGLEVAAFPAVEPSLRRPLPYLRAARTLARRFRQAGVDLVHCADVLSAHYVATAGRLAGVPVVCHVRNRHDNISRRDQLFLRPVQRWVCVSEDTRRRFSYPVDERNSVVIYDGIEVPRLGHGANDSVRAEFGIPAGAAVVGMVGRLSPQKDFVTLGRAAQRVLASRPDARFVVVGDHEREKAYQEHFAWVRAQLDQLGVLGSFVFTGFRSDVARLVSAMDVFVLSTHFEGLPLVLLEGMAQARPTLATAVDGIPEVVEHDRTGLLHGREDAATLADQIAQVLSDHALATRLGLGAREAVERFWSADRFASDMTAFYRAMLPQGKEPGARPRTAANGV